MSESTRTPTTLLVVILLAVLVEPFLLAMLLSGGDDAGRGRTDPRLARAIEELTTTLTQRREERLPPTEDEGPTASDEVLDRIARALERLPGGGAPAVFPTAPPAGGYTEDQPMQGFPTGGSAQERVDAVLRQEAEWRASRQPTRTTRFFLTPESEILHHFGTPTNTYVGNGWVRYFFRGSEGKQFYLDVMDGRVVRFGY